GPGHGLRDPLHPGGALPVRPGGDAQPRSRARHQGDRRGHPQATGLRRRDDRRSGEDDRRRGARAVGGHCRPGAGRGHGMTALPAGAGRGIGRGALRTGSAWAVAVLLALVAWETLSHFTQPWVPSLAEVARSTGDVLTSSGTVAEA